MADELSFFLWSVPESGFQWVKTETVSKQSGLFLSDGVASGQHYMRRTYNPLLQSGLFRDFSETQPTEKGILGFANRYGSLGGTAAACIAVQEGLGSGELFGLWVSEIVTMRELVDLRDRTRGQVATQLAERIKWDGSRGVRYEGPRVSGARPPWDGSSAWIASENHNPEMLSRFPPGDLVGPARSFLQGRINRKLAGHGVTVRLLWDPNYTQLGLHVVPTSLIGCLWLQFAKAVDGDKDYRRCPECRKWFDVSPHESRTDRVFCSPSCKAAAHRKKIAEARRLFAQRVPIRQIAKKLDTQPETVKGWVKT